MTTFLQVKNNASTTLAAAITTTGQTAWVLTDSSVFPTTYPYHLTCDDEIVEVSNNNTETNTLTVSRGEESTVAATHSSGVTIGLRITAQIISDLNTEVANVVYNEVPSGLVNGTNVTFTLANTPDAAASLCLYVNGIRFTAGGEDFTLATATITFVTAPPTNSIILADYKY